MGEQQLAAPVGCMSGAAGGSRRAGRGLSAIASGLIVTMVLAGPAWAQGAPNPPAAPPPGLDAAANTFLGWLKWGGLVAGVLGLGISGIMMMVGRRNRSTMAVDGASGIPWVIGGLTVMSFAASITSAVLK